MDAAPRIATIMTCRRAGETALASLAALVSQQHFREEDLFLVADGKVDAVRAEFPRAHLFDREGAPSWCRAMNRGWQAALDAETAYDWYFWLGEDVLLDPGALDRLLADALMCADPHEPLIMAGATLDGAREMVTSGAHWQADPQKALNLTPMKPDRVPQMAATVDGRAVLVSAPAQRALGLFDPAFENAYAELDYSLRAQAEGIPVMLAGEPVGVCERAGGGAQDLDSSLASTAWSPNNRGERSGDWRRLKARHGGGALAKLQNLLGL